MNAPAADTFLSVVVPVRDAAAKVEAVVLELQSVLQPLFRNYEMVLVDDDSADDTVAVIQRLQKSVENLQLYVLNRRCGLDIALVAGLDNSIGDFVITLNVETDSPSLIPQLWSLALQGNESVCGVRTDVRRNLAERTLSRWFYSIFYASTGYRIPYGVTDLRLYSRRVVNYMGQNNDRHLLLKVLPFFALNKTVTLNYVSTPGAGSFGSRALGSNIFTAVAILLASSVRPLRILTMLAILASSLSLLYAVYVVAVAIFKTHVVEGWISLALPMAAMFFFLSLILGVLSEYIYLVSRQSGNRPIYSVSEESTSSVLKIQKKLNVVEGSGGDFASRSLK